MSFDWSLERYCPSDFSADLVSRLGDGSAVKSSMPVSTSFAGSRRRSFWPTALTVIVTALAGDAGGRAAAAEDLEIIESYIAVAGPEAPRQSEGDVAVLKDGSLLAAWSDFYEKASDHAPARISAARSMDGGRSWGARYTLQENTGGANVMSVSLLRARSGALLFFYLQKNSRSDLKVLMRRSTDEAKTWSESVTVTMEGGYHVMNNARVIQLRSGRLLAPVATTREVGTKNDEFKTVVYFSDDEGRAWQRGRTLVGAPKRGAMEPGLIELKDGRVQQIIRTQTGEIWQSISSDAGDTWSAATSWGIASPEAPATIARAPGSGDWLLVLNPEVVWGNPEKTVLGANHGGPRRPLGARWSRDEGKTWGGIRTLEADPALAHAYTSITFHEGRVLLTYYEYSEATKRIGLKFKSVPVGWFRR